MIETFEINEQFIMNIRFLCCNYLHISHKAIIYTFHTKQLFTHFTQSNYLHISHKAIIYTFNTKQLFTQFTLHIYLVCRWRAPVRGLVHQCRRRGEEVYLALAWGGQESSPWLRVSQACLHPACWTILCLTARCDFCKVTVISV